MSFNPRYIRLKVGIYDARPNMKQSSPRVLECGEAIFSDSNEGLSGIYH